MWALVFIVVLILLETCWNQFHCVCVCFGFGQEQEAYISQLETQQRVPKGKEVVHPMPGFVIKTRFWKTGKEDERKKVRRIVAHVDTVSSTDTVSIRLLKYVSASPVVEHGYAPCNSCFVLDPLATARLRARKDSKQQYWSRFAFRSYLSTDENCSKTTIALANYIL